MVSFPPSLRQIKHENEKLSLGAYLLPLCHILNNAVLYSHMFDTNNLLAMKHQQNDPSSDINGSATKNATSTALSHAWFTGYSTGN